MFRLNKLRPACNRVFMVAVTVKVSWLKEFVKGPLETRSLNTAFNLIGHVRVPKTLTFKMRLGAQPFLWKWVLFAWEWKMISISEAEHLSSFWNRGPVELGNGVFLRFVFFFWQKNTKKNWNSCWPRSQQIMKRKSATSWRKLAKE